MEVPVFVMRGMQEVNVNSITQAIVSEMESFMQSFKTVRKTSSVFVIQDMLELFVKTAK